MLRTTISDLPYKMSDIKIQCPECHESFQVPEDLLGQDVECGTCHHPFTLSDEDIDKLAMRHFPGEKAAGLTAFSKRAPAEISAENVTFETASYDQQVDPNAALPIGPRRLIAIFIGISVMVLLLLLFLLGHGEQGVMADVPDDKRWVLAGFSALVGSLLIIFGFIKYRVAGVILAVVLSVAVCSMPVIYPAHESSSNDTFDSSENLLDAGSAAEVENLLKYKIDLGYSVVERKIEEAEDPEKVLAIALMRSKPVHVDTIQAYLASALATSEMPRVFLNRELNGLPTTLMVYLDAELSITEAAAKMQKFGSVTKVRPEMRVIEVLVDVDSLSSSHSDVLLAEAGASFYEANLEELKHIDPSRRLDAIRRLAKVDKLYLQADIVGQLLVLLETPRSPHRAELVAALNRWCEGNKKVEGVVVSQARKLAVTGEEVPMSYLNFLVDQRVENSGDILIYAWQKDSVVHEATLVRAGKIAEIVLIEMMPELDPFLLQSAANVLRKSGSKDALPALLIAYESANGDVKKSLKATIDVIESRE